MSKCWDVDASKEMHLGSSADISNFGDSVLICVGGSVDAASYDPTSKICCAASWDNDNVTNPNIKRYQNGVLKYTSTPQSNWVCMHTCIWQTNPGWYAIVRFDFCDGNTVIWSRETTWGTPPPPPEADEEADETDDTTIAIGATKTIAQLAITPTNLSAGDDPTCKIKTLCPWDTAGAEWEGDYKKGDTKIFTNPANMVEMCSLTLDDFFRGSPDVVTLTAWHYPEGFPADIAILHVDAPQTAEPGDTITVTVSILNNINYPSVCRVLAYITLAGTRTRVIKAIAGSATAAVPLSITIPADAKKGVYEVGARIFDRWGQHGTLPVPKRVIAIGVALPPTIHGITWQPRGDFHVLDEDNKIHGATSYLRLITTDPADYPENMEEGQAMIQIVDNPE